MNFLNRVYENFNTIDTNLRKVSPIKVIKFSDSGVKREFYVEKSLLFDMYLRSASSYKINKNKIINGSYLIPIDNNC